MVTADRIVEVAATAVSLFLSGQCHGYVPALRLTDCRRHLFSIDGGHPSCLIDLQDQRSSPTAMEDHLLEWPQARSYHSHYGRAGARCSRVRQVVARRGSYIQYTGGLLHRWHCALHMDGHGADEQLVVSSGERGGWCRVFEDAGVEVAMDERAERRFTNGWWCDELGGDAAVTFTHRIDTHLISQNTVSRSVLACNVRCH